MRVILHCRLYHLTFPGMLTKSFMHIRTSTANLKSLHVYFGVILYPGFLRRVSNLWNCYSNELLHVYVRVALQLQISLHWKFYDNSEWQVSRKSIPAKRIGDNGATSSLIMRYTSHEMSFIMHQFTKSTFSRYFHWGEQMKHLNCCCQALYWISTMQMHKG